MLDTFGCDLQQDRSTNMFEVVGGEKKEGKAGRSEVYVK